MLLALLAEFAAAMAGTKLGEIRRRRAKPRSLKCKPISPFGVACRRSTKNRATPAKLNLVGSGVQTMKRLAPKDSIVTNGAGNFATWAHRFWPYAGIEHCDKSQLCTHQRRHGLRACPLR